MMMVACDVTRSARHSPGGVYEPGGGTDLDNKKHNRIILVVDGGVQALEDSGLIGDAGRSGGCSSSGGGGGGGHVGGGGVGAPASC